MNGLIGINHLRDIGHHYRRSRSREADRVKSGSGRSHDDERQLFINNLELEALQLSP
ncbi:hypothetical protein CUMW_207340 [Citrus unshiu]|uniref:Uncharacterized protein n=1 Tax=Citrus unshiu TaxID=55188 RepID=A0A2H5Q910_CITUN|nr:hypothetical protein CUMW_207340 [Citrus unshiu]